MTTGRINQIGKRSNIRGIAAPSAALPMYRNSPRVTGRPSTASSCSIVTIVQGSFATEKLASLRQHSVSVRRSTPVPGRPFETSQMRDIRITRPTLNLWAHRSCFIRDYHDLGSWQPRKGSSPTIRVRKTIPNVKSYPSAVVSHLLLDFDPIAALHIYSNGNFALRHDDLKNS